MDLQKLTFFTEGNTFTGSASKALAAGLLLRYLVEPDKENEQLKAYAWRKDLCFERAGEKEEREFPMTQQGLEEADAWLQGLFDAL